VIVKPVNNTKQENVACAGKSLPPTAISIQTDDFEHSGDYSFPSDFIAKAAGGQGGELEYDVAL